MTRHNKYLFKHPEIQIDYYSERLMYTPDEEAVKMLERNLPRWVSDRLRENIKESLRGLSFQMARDIVIYVTSCAKYGQCEFTCLPYVDRLLAHHYNALVHEAEKKGVSIA